MVIFLTRLRVGAHMRLYANRRLRICVQTVVAARVCGCLDMCDQLLCSIHLHAFVHYEFLQSSHTHLT